MLRAKFLFLDIDGVLNSDRFYNGYMSRNVPIPRPPIDRFAVALLDRIIDHTGAFIVLSTSWRAHPNLPGWLLEHGCRGMVVGATPKLMSSTWHSEGRGKEIAWWLNRKSRQGIAVESFCILDDTDDMNPVKHALVQTTQTEGLTNREASMAIAMLNGERR